MHLDDIKSVIVTGLVSTFETNSLNGKFNFILLLHVNFLTYEIKSLYFDASVSEKVAKDRPIEFSTIKLRTF